MSIRASNWAWAVDLTPTPKIILLALADEANDDGESCYPGQERLAYKAGVSVRTIRSHLAELEQQGFIRRYRRPAPNGQGRSSDGYILALDQPAESSGSPATNRKLTHDQPEADDVSTGNGFPGTREGPVSRTRENPSSSADAADPQNDSSTGGESTGSGDRDSGEDPPESTPAATQRSPEERWGEDVARLTRHFGKLVRDNGFSGPSSTRKAENWFAEMERLLRLGPPGDGGIVPDAAEVYDVMRWALVEDDFWPANIGSVPTFRRQYPRLRLKMRQSQQRQQEQEEAEAPQMFG